MLPAADLSEQISMAGKEAGHGQHEVRPQRGHHFGHAGRGQHRDLRDLVGAENFFLFGLTADEVFAAKQVETARGAWRKTPNWLRPSRPHRLGLLLARRHRDLPAYRRQPAQPRRIHAPGGLRCLCRNRGARAPHTKTARRGRTCRSSTARAAATSSDRTMRQYCTEIWGVRPVAVSRAALEAGRS